jgi:hypothetical protein
MQVLNLQVLLPLPLVSPNVMITDTAYSSRVKQGTQRFVQIGICQLFLSVTHITPTALSADTSSQK